MNGLEELKKKLSDIETQSIAWEGCGPTFTVSDIMDLIDSVESDKQKAESAQNVPNGDHISRQAAIDAVKRNTFRLTFSQERNCEGHVAWSAEAVYSDVMEDELLDLPSAQPEPCGDMISREYLKEHIEACWINGRPRHAPELNELLSWIDDVPSAQPEIITCTECKYHDADTEQCNNENGLRFIDYSNPAGMWCSWAERREE